MLVREFPLANWTEDKGTYTLGGGHTTFRGEEYKTESYSGDDYGTFKATNLQTGDVYTARLFPHSTLWECTKGYVTREDRDPLVAIFQVVANIC